MNGQYPRFKNSYFYEELTEHFLLTTTELEFVRSCSGNANRQGIAILLKGLEYLGYFPENLQQVPPSIRSFVGKQLGLLCHRNGQAEDRQTLPAVCSMRGSSRAGLRKHVWRRG